MNGLSVCCYFLIFLVLINETYCKNDSLLFQVNATCTCKVKFDIFGHDLNKPKYSEILSSFAFNSSNTIIEWPSNMNTRKFELFVEFLPHAKDSTADLQIFLKNTDTGEILVDLDKLYYIGKSYVTIRDCPLAQYGKPCQPCSLNCEMSGLTQVTEIRQKCDMKTGNCLSGRCMKNSRGPKCDKCGSKYYGDVCQHKCGHCLNNKQCDRITGICAQCAPGYLGNKCDVACQAGRFGMNCKGSCNCYRGVPCNPVTGSCGKYGCAMRYSGAACNIYRACSPGTYGNKCQPCSTNCEVTGLPPKDFRQICNSMTGVCLSGKCLKTFSGPKCDKCKMDRYGFNCQYICGHCLHKDDCHYITGECTQCKAGYLGNKCDIECSKGRYGFNCEEKCSNCANDNVCHFVTGKCPGNCKPGWKGDKCEIPDDKLQCNKGFYGSACSQKCHNCQDDRCDKVTGICTLGCKMGFQGKFCEQPCTPGRYGLGCSEFCGVCSNWKVCNSTTGKCAYGCMGNFIPPFCDECPYGWFGPECNEKCGHCKDSVECDKIIGSCPEGCDERYTGPFCKTKKTNLQLQEESDDL